MNDYSVYSTLEENISNLIKRFPNPVSNPDQVEMNLILIGENWTSFKTLEQRAKHDIIQSRYNRLDIQNLPKGMYLIKLENAITLSLIKQ